MITKSDIVYFFAVMFNKIHAFFTRILAYLEGVTRRVNKMLLNDDAWLIANDFYMNSSNINAKDVGNFEGFVYKNDKFISSKHDWDMKDEHGFPWIGAEFSYRKDDAVTTFDLTDWLAKQRIFSAKECKEPSPREILIAWAIATDRLPILCYNKINDGSAIIKLTNLDGDDVEVLWRGETIDKSGVDAVACEPAAPEPAAPEPVAAEEQVISESEDSNESAAHESAAHESAAYESAVHESAVHESELMSASQTDITKVDGSCEVGWGGQGILDTSDDESASLISRASSTSPMRKRKKGAAA